MGNYKNSVARGLHQLLPKIVDDIRKNQSTRPDLILSAWAQIVGEKISSMTQAVSFEKGVLHVSVKNSTLHSLLAQYEKVRLLKTLKEKFPNIEIRNIFFRIG